MTVEFGKQKVVFMKCMPHNKKQRTKKMENSLEIYRHKLITLNITIKFM